MKKLELKNYQKNRFEKLDSIVISVNIERRHKAFIERHRVNLSAFVRDAIDCLMDSAPKAESENKSETKEECPDCTDDTYCFAHER